MNYYNENDDTAASMLENLIFIGAIPDGVVDRRSIEDVLPSDLAGFAQCHFFAGIGGWSYALQLAGWPEDRQVWTGSCPCQPFSAAGEGSGFVDERHLWPAFENLIRQCRPAAVFGEQVASAAAGPWIDLVSTDLEALGYSVGAVAFPAASVGAPHIRDRTYWVGYADDARSQGYAGDGGPTGGEGSNRPTPEAGVLVRLADSNGVRQQPAPIQGLRDEEHHSQSRGGASGRPGPVNGHWRAADWLLCRDEKWRPVEPGTFPLDHGVRGRVGILRGYGNAIVPQQAAQFVLAAEEAKGMML